MTFKIFLLLAIIAYVGASVVHPEGATSFSLYNSYHVGNKWKATVDGHTLGGHGQNFEQQVHAGYEIGPQYEYKYNVEDHHTGDHKGQHEIKNDGIVKGEYSVLDPDGTYRKVEYTADDVNGFNAVVLKTGTSSHPTKEYAPILESHAEHIPKAVSVQNIPVFKPLPVAHARPVQQGWRPVSAPRWRYRGQGYQGRYGQRYWA